MKAVLLAGGLGTRMREETEFRPKPMVEVGGRPVLWHIMKLLSQQGISDFVICTGYKSEQIKDYFLNYNTSNSDFTVDLGKPGGVVFHDLHGEQNWRVTVADTGTTTNTGGRLKAVEKHLEGEDFLCTYGDGLANVDLGALREFHKNHGRLATVTTARPSSRFGLVETDAQGLVTSFREKPVLDEWVNIGYFIFGQNIFKLLDNNSVLEEEPLNNLAQSGELGAFKHDGFWQPMDTFRESKLLNDLWDSGQAPWKNW
jgi:glucose-1-phosphate cytidylyltransferase